MSSKDRSVSKPTTSELQEWEDLLRAEGLSMERGHNGHRVVYGYEAGLSVDMKLSQVDTWVKQARKSRSENTARLVSHCAVCGRSFTAKDSKARFCGTKCRVKNARRVTQKSNPLGEGREKRNV